MPLSPCHCLTTQRVEYFAQHISRCAAPLFCDGALRASAANQRCCAPRQQHAPFQSASAPLQRCAERHGVGAVPVAGMQQSGGAQPLRDLSR